MFILVILIVVIVGGTIAYLKAFGLIYLVDMVTLGVVKSRLEPEDDSPGLIRLFVPAMLLFSDNYFELVETNRGLWLLTLIPGALASFPAIKYLCRMSWPNALRAGGITLGLHIIAVLLLHNFGFSLKPDFQPRIMQ